MTAPDDPTAPLGAGSKVGRYEIVRVLGQGGMGVVYEAHDPQLDRRVAVKLLRRDAWAASELEDGRSRLLREAQAMARLSHPNVVSVFDAGIDHDQLYVAMEYVDGVTLRRWLASESLSQAAILDAFLSAARGLAAAHSVGLVHRDFKPENVLRNASGRISVADFGLAHSTPNAEPQSDVPAPSPRSGSSLGLRMTQSGTLLGTPAYMAPEQLDGARADERTDQFSFCVALYEALYGQPPFSGTTLDELVVEVLEGRVRSAPSGSRVPDRLRQILLRGLSRDPAARYESMNVLIDALAPRSTRTRRRALYGAGVGIAALVAVVIYQARRPALLCRGADRKLAGVWDDARKQTMHTAFSATNRPYAEDAWHETVQALDVYTKSWVGMRVEACESTRVRGEQSEKLLDLRMACLDQRLEDVDALVNVLVTADDPIVTHAVSSVDKLPALGHCANVKELTARTALPTDQGARAQLDALGASVAQVKALIAAGKLLDALRIVKPLVAVADRLHYPPLQAAALGARGRIEMATGDPTAAAETLKLALLRAESAGDDEQVAKTWNDLMRAQVERGRLDEAEQAHQHALAFLKRLGDPAALLAEIDYTTGIMHVHAGQYEVARADFERSLEAWTKLSGENSIDFVRAADAIANCSATIGDGKTAVEYATRALAVDRKLHGPFHPDLVNSEQNLGTALMSVNRYQEAYAAYRHSLAIAEKSLPPDSPFLADAIGNWAGMQLTAEKRYPEAIAAYERVLAIQTKHGGPDAALIGQTLSNLGNIEQQAGKLDDAQRHLERALAMKEKALGPDHDEVAKTLVPLGGLAAKRKKWDESLALNTRAMAIFEKTLGPNSLDLVDALEGAGLAAVSLKQSRKAIPWLEHAIAIRNAPPQNAGDTTATDVANTRVVLARALWDAGEHKRALAEAELARVVLEKKDPDSALPELKTFLAHAH